MQAMAMTAHSPTDDQRHLVEVLVAGGTPKRTIARAMGIGMNTLRKRYKVELDTGLEMANSKVVRRLYRLIEQGSTPATIFWLKTRAGWKEGQTIEIEKKPDQPSIDYSKLSQSERDNLRAILEKAVRGVDRTH
jgi:transposase